MSIPPHPGSDPFSTVDRQSRGSPADQVRLAEADRRHRGRAGHRGRDRLRCQTLLHKENNAATSQETVQPAPPAPGASQAPTAPTAPMKLGQAVTDTFGALSSEQTAEVKSAVKSLQAAREVRLWVIYVAAFDGPPGSGSQDPCPHQDGDRDAILAIATKQRKYAFLVAPGRRKRVGTGGQ